MTTRVLIVLLIPGEWLCGKPRHLIEIRSGAGEAGFGSIPNGLGRPKAVGHGLVNLQFWSKYPRNLGGNIIEIWPGSPADPWPGSVVPIWDREGLCSRRCLFWPGGQGWCGRRERIGPKPGQSWPPPNLVQLHKMLVSHWSVLASTKYGKNGGIGLEAQWSEMSGSDMIPPDLSF